MQPHPLRSAARILSLLLGVALVAAPGASAWAQRRAPKPKAVTKADVDRLEKKLEEQQRLIERLIRIQQQYLQALSSLLPDGGSAAAAPSAPDVVAKVEPRPAPPVEASAPARPERARPATRPAPVAPPPPPPKRAAKGVGTVVGKVKGGGGDIYVYVADVYSSAGGSASMKQQGKQFVPRVPFCTTSTRVEFPNLDAVFHNVFSVTPNASFDLGSYRQGESKAVTMSKPGVVSVYCNMHPQMVGHILVVPSNLHARAGADGFYRLAGVPAGRHKIVAWAPNAKPVAMEVDVAADEVTTLELELKRGRGLPHLNKEGLPYGSYKD